jgi:hypothetical protein
MSRLHSVLLSSALLLAPISVTGAFAQSTSASSNAAPTTSVPAQTGGTSAKAGTVAGAAAADVVPSSKTTAQLQNPTGAQPGTGSGMGKVSGTAAGN